MLIYVPPAERAGVAALVCMVALCNLNYFRPHKNTLLFWLSQLSFVITTCKYITALVLSVAQHEAGEAGAGGGAGAEAQRRRVETIGAFLITLDVLFVLSGVATVTAAVWSLRRKMRGGAGAYCFLGGDSVIDPQWQCNFGMTIPYLHKGLLRV